MFRKTALLAFIAAVLLADLVSARHAQYMRERDPHRHGQQLLTVFGTEEVFQNTEVGQQAPSPSVSLSQFHASHPEGAFTQYLVTLKGPITTRVKDEVNGLIHPYHLDQYFPHNSFFVAGPSKNHPHYVHFISALKATSFVVRHEEWKARRKLEPNMLRALQADSDVASDILVELDQGTLILQGLSDFPEMRSFASAGAPQFMSRDDRRHVALHTAKALISQHVALSGVGATVSSHSLLHIPRAQHHSLQAIAQLPFVHWVEKKQEVQMQNKFVHSVVQDNNGTSTRFYDAGLHGEGQTIAIGDTGIDYDSCFFYDPNRATPIGRVDLQHRKIVTYIEFGSAGDEAHGHGTHTAGTLAGDVLTNDAKAKAHLSPFNGVAYKAKLAAYDFKRPDSELLYTPNDLYIDFFENSHKAGARIASNSWGAPAFYYDSFARFTDRFLHDYKDFIALYAAGNYGSRGLGTVTTPGSSKNCVAVGSTKSSPASWHELGYGLAIGSVQGRTTVALSFVPATFGGRVADFTPVTSVTAVKPTENEACQTIKQDLTGKIVVVDRGSCAFTIKAKNVQAAGGILMILQDYAGTVTPVKMGGDDSSIGIPCVAVTPSSANAILQNPVSIPVSTDLEPTMNQEYLSYFSSLGPTSDGRVKPEIVAPGQYLLSVDSDGSSSSYQCPSVGGLLEMQGTSMATPASAATTALVRQYFTDGFYPSGTKTAGDVMSPSGMLLKAVLMNSGVPLTSRIESLPSVYQGYGRIEIGTVLPLAGPSDRLPANYKLIVKDEATGVNTQAAKQYCFRVTESAQQQRQTATQLYNTPFKASLVWYDAAASASAGSLLVNNLDLSVFSVQNSKVYLGNDDKFTDPNTQISHILADNLNTAEQVIIDSVQAGDYLGLQVFGRHVPMGPQPFAIAVSGFVEEAPLSQCAGHTICPNNCASRGTCDSNGICKCPRGFTGADCSIVSLATPEVDRGVTYVEYSSSNAVASMGWAYFHLDVTDETIKLLGNDTHLAMEIGMTRLKSVGDPDLYVAYERFPDLGDFDFYSAECEPCGRTTSVSVPHVKKGRYYFGVYGYCCSGTAVSVTVKLHTADPEPSQPSSLGKGAIAGIVLGVLAVIIFIGAGIYYFKTRYQRAGFTPVQATGEVGGLTESLANDIEYIAPTEQPIATKPPPPSEPRPAYAEVELKDN